MPPAQRHMRKVAGVAAACFNTDSAQSGRSPRSIMGGFRSSDRREICAARAVGVPLASSPRIHHVSLGQAEEGEGGGLLVI